MLPVPMSMPADYRHAGTVVGGAGCDGPIHASCVSGKPSGHLSRYASIGMNAKFFSTKKGFGHTRLIRRLSPKRQQKSQDVSLFSVNGVQVKCLRFNDTHLAAMLERNLEAFEASPHFPSVIFRHENRLWLEFIEGDTIHQPDTTIAEYLAAIYAELYTRDAQRMMTRETPFPGQLHRDLRFLAQVKLFDATTYHALSTAAERLTPMQVWVGFDYTDPGFKNFVHRRDRALLCAIDVESLQDGQLLGTGLAKARWRWPDTFWELCYRQLLARIDMSDLEACLPFVELCALARWSKKKILIDQGKAVKAKCFERFRTLAPRSARLP